MLAALIAAEQTPAEMARLARGRLRSRQPELQRALEGRVTEHHRFLLRQLLAQVDFLDQAIGQVQARIERHLMPYEEALTLVQTIPGIRATSAAAILAEIGTDMTRFPSAKHLASWAGLCPGNKQSGGRRLQAATNRGNRWLRAVFGEVVWAVRHTKDNDLVAQYRRLARRRGVHKAVLAVAYTLIVVIYHVLRDHRPYADLGGDYFDRLDASRTERYHVHRSEQLGYSVTLAPAVA